MPLYWSLKAVPEMASLPKARRLAIWKECYPSPFRPLWVFVTQSVMNVAVFIIPNFLVTRSVRYLAWAIPAQMIAMYVIVMVCNHFRIVSVLPEIRRLVGGVCPHCGYDLRASKERCPECGTPIPAGASPVGEDKPVSRPS